MIAYGVEIRSDIPLPSFLPKRGFVRHAVRLGAERGKETDTARLPIRTRYSLHGRQIRHASQTPAGALPSLGDRQILQIGPSLQFAWESGSAEIGYRLHNRPSEKETVFWFLHFVLPFYLTVERISVLLHCSAVRIDDETVLFLGGYSSGKSTLADRLIRQGHTLVCDDVLATFTAPDAVIAAASHPCLRLGRERFSLGDPVRSYAAGTSFAIRKICLLQDGAPESAIVIEKIRGIEKFVKLREHGPLFSIPALFQNHSRHLMRLASQADIYRIRRPRDPRQIDELARRVRKHFRSGG